MCPSTLAWLPRDSHGSSTDTTASEKSWAALPWAPLGCSFADIHLETTQCMKFSLLFGDCSFPACPFCLQINCPLVSPLRFFLSQIFLLLTSFLVACRPCMGITIFIPCLRVLGWVSCGCEFAPTQLSLVRRLLEDPLPAPQDLLQMWHFPFPCLSHPVMRCSVTSLLSFC